MYWKQNKEKKLIISPCNFVQEKILSIFALLKTVVVAQLVRASDCDSEGRGFEPPRLPTYNNPTYVGLFVLDNYLQLFLVTHKAIVKIINTIAILFISILTARRF